MKFKLIRARTYARVYDDTVCSFYAFIRITFMIHCDLSTNYSLAVKNLKMFLR